MRPGARIAQSRRMTDSTRSSGARRTLALLLSLNLLCYIDRYILAAVEPQIRESFFANDPTPWPKPGASRRHFCSAT